MKLYDGGRAPNPRRVRIFLAEKGIKVETQQVDLGALEQKSADYSAINPLQRVPALVLDDGSVITESVAICRYFDAHVSRTGIVRRGPAARLPRSRCGTGASSCICCLAVAQVFRHLHPGDEGARSAAGTGMGRGQQAAGDGISRRARQAACRAIRSSPAIIIRLPTSPGLSPSI